MRKNSWKIGIKKIQRAIRRSVNDVISHDGIEHAGYLSFLSIISLFPFMIFITAVTGFLGKIYINGYLNLDISSYFAGLIVDSDFAPFVNALLPRLFEITSSPPPSLMTFAALSIIWSASSIFEGMRTILNRAYRIHNPPPYLSRRILSVFEFFFVVGVIILLQIFFSLIPNLIEVITQGNLLIENRAVAYSLSLLERCYEMSLTTHVLRIVVGMLIINYSYVYIPSVHQSFRDSLPGTLLVIGAFSLFRLIFQYYISTMPQINLIYGSLGGMVIALLFFYFCSTIFIWGAEFNYHMRQCRKKRR